jgi:hypothetical protein
MIDDREREEGWVGRGMGNETMERETIRGGAVKKIRFSREGEG